MKDHTYEGFNGMARSEPVLAAVNTIFLLSLTGIPLTAGFFGKYYMLAAVLSSGKFLWLVLFAILCAAVSAYYYFRVIQAMYFKEGDGRDLEVSQGFKALLILVAAVIILLGIFPQWLIDRLYFVYI
jgi:NADH-quinone oxidoreductase subunit N